MDRCELSYRPSAPTDAVHGHDHTVGTRKAACPTAPGCLSWVALGCLIPLDTGGDQHLWFQPDSQIHVHSITGQTNYTFITGNLIT